ncbi:hypothetical protein [Hymenobacter psychrotolerans]|uniref:SpoIIAA-like n=1 Tax=Hymenobacter psychrotolerans DSM 18569 TaxID=1121959 RepID=A0A1M6Q902_9BACT|nr:hypothetical protein [Hymenobacter psychrotolerans]SHK16563.1 hypothetical protein SAMN02746009_00480 [Hymenobacter psychrotolerans DSM 18569]
MTLFHTPDASLTYHPTTDMLQLSYSATRLTVSFGMAYQQALEQMLEHNVGKLLLDLKRNAPPTDDELELLPPLASVLPEHETRPLFIAAVVSEGQYQYQVGNSLAASASTLPPAYVEFNYFTSRREAADWLSRS